MATGLETLVGLTSVMNNVMGSSGTQTQRTSGGRTTSRLNVDQAGIDRMVQQMLTGQGGQGSITASARGSGVYNSTAERQLLNDLNARVAGEIAARTGEQVTETDPTVITAETQQGGMGLRGLAVPLGLSLVSSLFAPTETATQAASLGGTSLSSMLNNSPDPIGSLIGLATGDPIQGAMGLINQSADPVGSLIGELTGGTGVADLGSPLMDGISTALDLPVVGPLASLLFSGGDLDTFGRSMANMSAGALLAPTPLAPLAPLVGLLGGLFGGGSVICTALMKRGLLDMDLYEAGSEYLKTLSSRTISGYYLWGLGVAEKIDRGSKWAIRICLPFARSRTGLLASGRGFKAHLKYPLGTLTKFIGEPACYILGFIMEKMNGTRSVTRFD